MKKKFFSCFCSLYFSLLAGRDFSVTVFNPSHLNTTSTADEKHFVIVTASYNNARWWQDNLVSILSQNYKNFQIIITDDCSTDGTGECIQTYLENHELPCKVTVVKNHTRRGALQNIYRSIAWCRPDDIIVVVDGDDRLAHANVLTMLNEVYADPEVWMTHGRLQLASTGTPWNWQEPIPKTVIINNTFRSYYTIATHLRTFYTWLFRKIQLKDFLYKGSFFPVAQDVAWAIPLLELCGTHHAYIDTVTYLYNDVHPFVDAKINREMQLQLERYVRAKPAYMPLVTQEKFRTHCTQAADVIMYQAHNTPVLEETITSVIEYVRGIQTVYIMTSERVLDDIKKTVAIAQKNNPKISIVWCSIDGDTLKKTVMNTVFAGSLEEQYVLFVPMGTIVSQAIDLTESIVHLHNTQAYGFYFCTPSIPSCNAPFFDIDGVTYAWHFAYTPKNWITPGTLQMAIYKKQRLECLIKLLTYTSFDELEKKITLLCDTDQVGLFKQGCV